MVSFGKSNKKAIQAHQRIAVLKLVQLMKLYSKNTKLSITIQGDGQEIFDYSLPHPLKYTRNGNRYTLEYALNGYFSTKASNEYLNDIIARFTLCMKVLSTNISSTEENGIELSYFQGLKSIQRANDYERGDRGEDNVFWSIKLYTEDLIKQSGEGNLIAYSLLESFAFSRFTERSKDKSTLKAKCRGIWNWYNELDWIIPARQNKLTAEELKMTRSENAKLVAKNKTEKNRKTIINCITGLYAEELKKKNGKWHLAKIADRLSMTRETVSKYIKEYENEKETTE